MLVSCSGVGSCSVIGFLLYSTTGSGDQASHEVVNVALHPVHRDLADIVIAYLLLRDTRAAECPGHPHPQLVWVTRELKCAGPQWLDRHGERRYSRRLAHRQ